MTTSQRVKMQASETRMPHSQRLHERRIPHRSLSRLLDYLEDYRADRALVWTDLHRAAVDRLYHQDERITTWTAHWHHASGTPYLHRHGRYLFHRDATSVTRTLITRTHACTSTSA